MKLTILNIASVVAAAISLMAALRGVTLSATESDAQRRKKVWLFISRVTLMVCFALQLGVIAPGSEHLFRFWLFLFVIAIGTVGIILDYINALWGPRRATDTPTQIISPEAAASR